MNIVDSIAYDKEQWLEAMVHASGLSPEVFALYYVIEEYPVTIIRADNILVEEDHRFSVRQEFRVRPKTPEEKQLEIEMKEKNDGTN